MRIMHKNSGFTPNTANYRFLLLFFCSIPSGWHRVEGDVNARIIGLNYFPKNTSRDS